MCFLEMVTRRIFCAFSKEKQKGLWLLFGGEGHLTSEVPQEENDGRKDQHHDEIDGLDVLGRSLWIGTPPEDEHDFKNEKDDGQFHLSPDETSEFHSVIDPPREDPGGDRKRRGNRTQDEKVETCGLE